jgi:hypothetical protein
MPIAYNSEKALVDDFLSNISIFPFTWHGPLHVATEFNYSRGRTDIIASTVNGDLIAFEAKLIRWREALHQAYRNTCFAHYSYILLPEGTANQAVRFTAEFSRRSVGICIISHGQVQIFHESIRSDPLHDWLSERAILTITRGNVRDALQ